MPALSNKKKEKFAVAFAGSGKQAESALASGSTPVSAPAIGHRLLKDPSVRLRIRELCDNSGATEEALIDRMNVLSDSADDERVQFQATKDLLNRRGLVPEPDDEVSARALIRLGPDSAPEEIVAEIRLNMKNLNPRLLEMLINGKNPDQDS